ncbi:MAG: 23S rRNA (pseudouridine(1915)-N(3))-methyltransferase RlmH [Pseudomonadota bacterium]|nr:23S rRNA (pseudouridine(1915)-N(3))-methyltransferase RlmH [Pseudomonadota bacterium]
MVIKIIYIGNTKSNLNHIYQDYISRIKNIKKTIGLKDIIFKEIKNSNKKNIKEIKEEESIKLLNQKTNGSLNILLDRKGKKIDSIKFSNLFYEQSLINKNINFFIGGSNGLKEKYHKDFDRIISFGDLTWPHKMFKIMLLEQIYRSITIINNHPYHK